MLGAHHARPQLPVLVRRQPDAHPPPPRPGAAPAGAALDALGGRGIRVPGSVAVGGFDNWNIMTNAARPPLSSVDMNLSALGREAGRMLIAMIDGERASGTRRLPCTLIVRESSQFPAR